MSPRGLAAELIAEEGLRLHAYRDGGGVWTIGVGHTGPGVHAGLVWTRAQALEALDRDIAAVRAGLDVRLPWWRTLSPGRQDVLADMAFNLGVEGLLAFRHTLEAVRAGDYALAAERMLASEPWRSQVGVRAERLAARMRGDPETGDGS